MRYGKVIIINGTSSSGKTSILRAFQDLMPEPYLDMGIDRFIWMLPRRYLDRPLWDDVLGKATEAGRSGRRLIHAMHRAIAAVAGLGNHVIADHVLVERVWVDECTGLFADKPAYLIGIQCPLEILEQRESQRRDRTLGQARAQFQVIHKYCKYDLTLDTSVYSPEECAARIAVRMQAPPRAFKQLKAEKGVMI